MAILSVNVNKIATLRNARGGNNPDVIKTALDIVEFGAQGITVHPRPDERHIRKVDVHQLASVLDVEFNVEGYPSADFIDLIQSVKPAQTTLVPDPPDVLTSNAGWKVSEHKNLLKEVVPELKTCGTRVSLFYDPYDLSEADLAFMKEIGTDRIELYTEMYARAFAKNELDEVTETYAKAARAAVAAGLEVNAGHDLDLNNLPHLIQQIPEIKEVSIGHALVCDALYLGLETTVKRYLQACGL